MRRHFPFFLILLGYFAVAGLYAMQVPAWQAPDEPAHYNVVRQIAQNGCCPLIQMGDWDQSLLDELKSTRFANRYIPAEPISGIGMPAAALIIPIEYEDHQPPLYYMLLAPVYNLTNGSLTALRLASVLIGSGVVIAAYAVSLRAFAGKYGVALAAAAFVAFLPQHVHILASINNDALAFALVGAILWASIDYADGGKTPAWALGLLVGAALLTKSTAYLMGGVALLAVLIGQRAAWRVEREKQSALTIQNTAQGSALGAVLPSHPPTPSPSRGEGEKTGTDSLPDTWHSALGTSSPLSTLHSPLVTFLVPAGILGLLWWGRNIVVYGFPDFLGLRAHDEVVIGQLRTADYIAEIGANEYLGEAVKTVVTSFYGQFGWMGVPLWSSTVGLLILLALIVVTLGGLVLAAFNPARKIAARGTWRVFGATSLLSVLMLLYYNTSFVQFQGRYIYPLLIPLAVTVALGLDGLRERLPFARQHAWLTGAALSLLALADVYVLLRMIVPSLTP